VSALLFWLTGLRAAEVSARMTAPGSGVDLYDAATVTFDQGAIGVISGAATLPDDDKFQSTCASSAARVRSCST